jgi:hypothetical protein
MKHPKSKILLTIAFSVALFVFGMFIYGQYPELLLPKVDGGFYQVTEIAGSFKATFIFSLVLSLAPLSLYLVWQFSPVISRTKKMISIGIVIVCLVLAIIGRQQMIKSYFTSLLNNVDNIRVSYPLNEVHFEYYLFLGLCIGCCISFFALRQKRS